MSNAQPQKMFFRSEQVDAHWDTWMYYDRGVYYLYYLITESSPGEGFGVATSPDGVTWTDYGWAIHASDKMVSYLGTGAVWPNNGAAGCGAFICNYSEWRREGDKETQNILFAWSDDLIHWLKLGDAHIFPVDTRWYDRYGRWDCIYPLPRPEGGYYGYWTATPNDHVGFGVGASEDGVHWEALPAPDLEWGEATPATSMEAGATEAFGDAGRRRYYAMTGQSGHTMRTMISDHPTGPFRAASKNYLLLGNSGRHGHTYFARFFRTPDGILVNHHAIPRFKNAHDRPFCYFAPLKRAYVDDEGTLWLHYWEGNEKLKQRPVPLSWDARFQRLRMAQECLNASAGVVLEGMMRLPSSDGPGDSPGLYVAYGADRGTSICVGAGGVTRFGLVNLASAAAAARNAVVEDTMAREWPFRESVRFRLLLKTSVLEFYLDDLYIQSYSLPQEATGQIGLLGAEAITDVQAWQTT